MRFRAVLQLLKKPDLRLNKFITRRIDHILMLSNETEWRFCPSKLNAADVGSRPDLGTFQAESKQLPDLIKSKDFYTSLGKKV